MVTIVEDYVTDRFHYRTSRNTGVSLGCFATFFLLAFGAAAIALPFYLLGMLLGVEHSTAWGIVMLAAPAPMWWAHLRGCAWTAAWLCVRGREMQAPREVMVDSS